jgi:hypothetical protein
MSETQGDYKMSAGKILQTPQEVAFNGVELIRAVQAGEARSLAFPIVGMQYYVAPLAPWETMVIIAQTSQYKSGFIDFWEYSAAEQFVAQGRTDEAILHISLEESIEAMAFRGFARLGGQNAGDLARGKVDDWEKLIAVSTRLAGVPIYRIGKSTMNRGGQGIELHLSNIQRAIDMLIAGEINGQPVKLGGVFVDYLQALPLDPEVQTGKIEMQRRLQIIQDVYRLQEWPVRYNCPVVYAAQAKQKLSAGTGAWQLPTFDDGEESNVLAQRPDRIVTQWLPKQTATLGEVIEHASLGRFRVEENTMITRVAKQRGGLPAGKVFVNRIDYEAGTIVIDPKFAAYERQNAAPKVQDHNRAIHGQE